MDLKDLPSAELDKIELDERKKLQAAQLQMQIISSQENLQIIALEKSRRVKEEIHKKDKKK